MKSLSSYTIWQIVMVIATNMYLSYRRFSYCVVLNAIDGAVVALLIKRWILHDNVCPE